MRTMSGGPCLHYDCSNRNSFGYCKTTVCINEHYQREQWGLPSTTNESESVVIKQQTNADRIRNMTDEELAAFLCGMQNADDCHKCVAEKYCEYGHTGMIDWLKQEVSDDPR